MRVGVILKFLCLLLACGSDTAALAADAGSRDIDYARDVLPILSAKCYHCHGPDEEARQMELRLDRKEGAFRVEEGVAVIVPGKPAQSELVRRITSSDPDEVMPPSDDIRKLTAREIETLKLWVQQGAKWGTHWAFVPPQPPVVPEGHGQDPIDAFIGARLAQEKLDSAPQADKSTLLRRVTLDLTGLPPTPAEIDRFLADDSPDAYEKRIDRLLASRRYGERMAADWLDVARYADTHGYQMDRYRPMWPWRDWVIKAFNENLPFDDFLTWQLAGDLLPNPTKEQRLATAFNRLHMQNEEGGVVEEEFRVAYVNDRVTTMGTAFLGLTFECSRCHDHKYDPITQKDFYSLFAFFQNIDESGQTSYFTEAMPTPTLLLSTDEQDAKLAALRSATAAKEQELATIRAGSDVAFQKWLGTKRDAPTPIPGLTARFAFDEPPGTQPVNAAQPAQKAIAVDAPKSVAGRFGNAAELTGENGFVFPQVGDFLRADAFSLGIWVNTPTLDAPRMVIVHKSRAPADAASRGYELLLENGRVAFGLHHFWPGNSLKVVSKKTVTAKLWTHVAITYDGSSRAAGVRIYIDGESSPFNVVRDKLTKDIRYGGKEPDLAIGHRFRDNGFKGGKVDDFRVFNRALTPLEVLRVAARDDAFAAAWKADPNAMSLAHRDLLRDYFVNLEHPPAMEAAQELATLRRQENELVTPIPEAMVMDEMPTTKPAFVLYRGAYDQPRDAVSADTPAFLLPFPSDQPRNRLGLARWALDEDNPLTSRVIVNRAWQQMFGRGIVETTENFGTQGALPTHPQLLDWLAREFSGEMRWDMKRLLKTIAMSAAYRRSSVASPHLRERDPDNLLLARGPSRRLTAEMLRDQALSVSGLLVEHVGGPSVKPYQPEGIWDVAMGRPVYDQDKGQGLYRRSLYTFWKRSVPPPSMMLLDAADKNYCTVRRQSTSTPLQALALLNDPQITEAARFVAQRMLAEGGETTDSRVTFAFRLVAGRKPTERELPVLAYLYRQQHDLFVADPGAIEKLLDVGVTPNQTRFDRAELAAGTMLGIALFNHDGAVMRR